MIYSIYYDHNAPHCPACNRKMGLRSDRTEHSCQECELKPLLNFVDELPFCPDCNASWQYREGVSMTLVGYGSPPGHDHDDNCRHDVFTCINGHRHVMRKINSCHCGWTGKDVCTICDRPGSYIVRTWPTARDGYKRP
jgi:hypothetical protein